LASPAVFTPQRSSNHTTDAEVGLVKLPKANELIDDSFLLSHAIQLWHKSGIIRHADVVEIGTKAVEEGKRKIRKPVLMVRVCYQVNIAH
jgi:hypothetical protein